MAIDRHEGTNRVDAGNSRQPMSLDGRLDSVVGQSITTSGVAEETLKTFTIPRGALNSDGKMLKVKAVATTAGNANNKSLGVRVTGPSGTSIYASGNFNINNGVLIMEVLIMRVAANSFHAVGITTGITATPGAGLQQQQYNASIADLLGNGFTLAITGTTGTQAGDVTLRAAMVDLLTEGGL